MSTIPNIQLITSKSSFLDTKEFTIEILTPVHIGSGREFTYGLDFTTTPSHTAFYDLEKIFKDFAGDEKFLKAIESLSIQNFLDKNGTGKNYYKQEFEGSAKAATIREFMMLANGKPVIPGSSIKGAIRTALLTTFFKNKPVDISRLLENKKDRAANKIERQYMIGDKIPIKDDGQIDTGKIPNFDIGRVLRVFDSTFEVKNLEVCNINVINLAGNSLKNGLYQYSWKNLINKRNGELKDASAISVLSLSVKSKSKVRISLDTNVQQKIGIHNTKKITWNSLANAMNTQAMSILNYELNFFQKVIDGDKDSVFIENSIKKLQKLLSLTQSKITWIQQVGWGTGWQSKTGLLTEEARITDVIRKKYGLGKCKKKLKEDREFKLIHPIFPKSRKIAKIIDEEGYLVPTLPMGWIKITEV